MPKYITSYHADVEKGRKTLASLLAHIEFSFIQITHCHVIQFDGDDNEQFFEH